jgi:hypothetical protein
MQRGQTAAGSWRNRVKNWLQNVEHNRRMLGYDIRSAASYNQQPFPSNVLLRFVVGIARELAVRLVRMAIKDAASSLGLKLSDGDLDLLAELAVTGISG